MFNRNINNERVKQLTKWKRNVSSGSEFILEDQRYRGTCGRDEQKSEVYQEHSIQDRTSAGGDGDRVGWQEGAERSKMPYAKSFHLHPTLHAPPGKQPASGPHKSGLLIFGALCYGEDRRELCKAGRRKGTVTCLALRKKYLPGRASVVF